MSRRIETCLFPEDPRDSSGKIRLEESRVPVAMTGIIAELHVTDGSKGSILETSAKVSSVFKLVPSNVSSRDQTWNR